jgi:hypothetical protein
MVRRSWFMRSIANSSEGVNSNTMGTSSNQCMPHKCYLKDWSNKQRKQMLLSIWSRPRHLNHPTIECIIKTLPETAGETAPKGIHIGVFSWDVCSEEVYENALVGWVAYQSLQDEETSEEHRTQLQCKLGNVLHSLETRRHREICPQSCNDFLNIYCNEHIEWTYLKCIVSTLK